MNAITFDQRGYRIDGAPVYLYSGEFHYFRVPKTEWQRRMQLFKEAGGNCIATYIPWLIHEPSEGNIVFGGPDAFRDLEGFLQTAREVGLYVIARPGPYQYSELKYDGLPGWLCENYPALRAHTIDGKSFRTASISYLHPLFLAKVQRWFSQACEIVARYTVSRGGPVAFVQLDNEMTGIHTWFGSLDYNAETMGFGKPDGRYPRFLRQRYRDMDTLNRAYGASFERFEDVHPLAPSNATKLSEIRRVKDYFDFYLNTIAEYSQTLAQMLRANGIDVPLVHNSANPGMNAYFSETVEALGRSFLLGSDHYYNLDQNWQQNNPTPQYAINVFCSNEMLRLMGFPPTVFELPGGSLSDWPPVTPQDARACYMANVALGMKGSNYYIFTGGPNAPGSGVTADVYDYGAAIGPYGEIRPLYDVQKAFGHFMIDHAWLAEAERETDCRIALDFEYVRSDYYNKGRGPFAFSGTEAWDFLRKGVLTTAFCASLSPALCNLSSDDWLSDGTTPVIVVSAISMARASQQRIVQFLKRGGRVLITPVLPTLDEDFAACTLLSDFLGSPTVELNTNAYPRVTIGNVVNIWKNGDLFTSPLPAGAKALGQDEISGKVVAWKLNTAGNGQVIFLGLRWYHAKREHEQMLKALLSSLGLSQKVNCSNPNVWTSLRTAGDRSMLFILNLLSSPMDAQIDCRPAWSNEILVTGRHELGPMSVKTVEIE